MFGVSYFSTLFLRFDTVLFCGHAISVSSLGQVVLRNVCSSSMFRLGDTVEYNSSVFWWCLYAIDELVDI